jgi:hypothetical protein
MVLTSLEAFETLTVHSGWATTDAAALLAELAARVLDAWRPPSTRQRPWPAAIVRTARADRAVCLPTCIGSRSWCDSYGGDTRHGPLGAAPDPRRDEPPQPALFHSGPSRLATEPGGLLAVGPDGPGRAGWRPRPAPAAVVQGPAAARPGVAGRGDRRPATVGPASSTTPPRRSARAAQGSARTWLWHGAADEEVPIAAARRMAQLLPSCRPSFTDEGHLMGLRHAGEAVEAIRGATAAQTPILALASPSSPDHSISHDDVADPHGQPGYRRSPGERRRCASRARASAAEAP